MRKRCQNEELKTQKIHVVSHNSFPTAAGLASSAAGFAALAVAIAELLGVKDSYPGELTTIARMGSGSACRSLSGGLVKWHLGTKVDGTDSIATQEAPEGHWPIDMTILVANAAKKHTSSTSGMQNSIKTSALMKHRVEHCVDSRIEELTKVDFVFAFKYLECGIASLCLSNMWIGACDVFCGLDCLTKAFLERDFDTFGRITMQDSNQFHVRFCCVP